MIQNLDDLVEFTERRGIQRPLLRDGIVIERPGCSQATIDKIRDFLPGMPTSYLDVVKAIRVEGIAIGYFELAPTSHKAADLAEKLLDWNANAGLHSRFEEDGVYEVASWEADPICAVYRNGDNDIGELVMYNVGNPIEPANVLANDYLQFLLLAGNLDAVRAQYADVDESAEAISEFEKCLAKLAPAKYTATWKMIAEVVLG